MNDNRENEFSSEEIPPIEELWEKYKDLEKKLSNTIGRVEDLSDDVEAIEDELEMDSDEGEDINVDQYSQMKGFPQFPLPPGAKIVSMRFSPELLNKITNFQPFETPESKIYCNSILNGEYTLCLTSDMDKSSSHNIPTGLLFECVANLQSPTITHEILDVFEFFQTSQYINFLIAYLKGVSAYSRNDFEMNVHVNDAENRQSVHISVDTESQLPEFLLSMCIANTERVHSSQIVSLNLGNGFPITESIDCFKSFTDPHVRYVVKLGQIISLSHRSFSDIRIWDLYMEAINPLINDAIEKFYSAQYPQAVKNQWNLNILFRVDYTDFEMRVIMDIVPAVYYIGDKPVRVSFTGEHWANIEMENINEPSVAEDMAKNYNRFHGTECTQVYSPGHMDQGEITTFHFSGERFNSLSYLFTNRRVLDVGGLSSFSVKMDYKKYEVYPSKSYPSPTLFEYKLVNSNHPIVCEYWVISPIQIPMFLNKDENRLQILWGFINFNISVVTEQFGDTFTHSSLLDTIKEDLERVFNIKALNGSGVLMMRECWRSVTTYRVALISILNEIQASNNNVVSKEPTNNKKSFFQKLLK